MVIYTAAAGRMTWNGQSEMVMRARQGQLPGQLAVQ